MAVVRPYRGVSAEQRRDERRERLLEAVLDVVADEGAAAVTVDAVCRRAGLTKRYFYESFADRDALTVAALDGVFDGVRAGVVTGLRELDDAGVEQRIALTAGVLVDTLAADRRRARLYVEAAAHPVLHARRDVAIGVFVDLMLTTVLMTDADDPRSRLVAVVLVAGATEAVTRWLAGGLDLDRDAVVDAITAIGVAAAGLTGL